MNKYYIMVNGQQMGPFTSAEIASKGYSTDSYVYNNNLGGWKMISEIPNFYDNTVENSVLSYGTIISDTGIETKPHRKEVKRKITYASWGSRIGAYLLDFIFISIFFIIFFGLVGAFFGTNDEVILAAYIPYFIVLLIYYAGLESSSKQGTWGKQIIGLKVVDSETNQKVSFGQAFGRFFSKLIISIIPLINLINYFSPLWARKKQTWHDMMSSCVVINK